MLALAAAVVFGVALILDLFDVRTGDWNSPMTLLFVGLLLLALHAAGIGGPSRFGRRGDAAR